MTTVEWLFNQLWEESKDKLSWYSILEQAKEIEKQMVIDIVEKSRATGLTAEYLLLIYGSKGSDDHVPDVRNMVQWIDKEILLNPHYADSPRLREGANMVKVKLQQYSPTSSQTEISDEEIVKKALEYKYKLNQEFFCEGAKWYREQLKSK